MYISYFYSGNTKQASKWRATTIKNEGQEYWLKSRELCWTYFIMVWNGSNWYSTISLVKK